MKIDVSQAVEELNRAAASYERQAASRLKSAEYHQDQINEAMDDAAQLNERAKQCRLVATMMENAG